MKSSGHTHTYESGPVGNMMTLAYSCVGFDTEYRDDTQLTVSGNTELYGNLKIKNGRIEILDENGKKWTVVLTRVNE